MSPRKNSIRSEAVRQRRRSEIQRRPRPQKKRAAASRDLPPITSRGVINDFAIERRKKANRHRFESAFSALLPDAPTLSLPRIQPGWRLLSFFLIILLGVGLYLLWTLPYFRVSAAQVTGNQRIPADEVNSVLGLSGRPVFSLNPARIEEQALQNYHEFVSVEVNVSLPNIVTINVTERQPLILWQQDGGVTWVDEEGIAFRPRGDVQGLILVQALAAPPASPVVFENGPASFVPAETVEALKALAGFVPAGTTIVYDPVQGLSWNDGRGWQVIFGRSTEDAAVKIRVYQSLVDWLIQRGTRPVLINVSYPNAPFYRVEQGQVEQ